MVHIVHVEQLRGRHGIYNSRILANILYFVSIETTVVFVLHILRVPVETVLLIANLDGASTKLHLCQHLLCYNSRPLQT